MDNKFDPMLREQSFSPGSSALQEEGGTVESGAWDVSQSANFSTGSPSVSLPAAAGSLDASKVPADAQSKLDDIWGSAGPTTEAQKPPSADLQSATNTVRLTTPLTKDAGKQTINPLLKALQEQIAKRTAAIDAATKEKQAKILAASKEYIEQQKSKREKQISGAKELHKKIQDNDGKKLEQFQKSGAVWNAVGMIVDLQKPNPYSKNTERMRSILSTLNRPDAVASK
ncbi:unnamed protein product [Phytomonas sp. EM1]|nr:unnamed protein product [Phytomonas sp. EM1]|eukprot:CCW60841.1 unnamed protein product [Phytomonas sp. isolate EM1]